MYKFMTEVIVFEDDGRDYDDDSTDSILYAEYIVFVQFATNGFTSEDRSLFDRVLCLLTNKPRAKCLANCFVAFRNMQC